MKIFSLKKSLVMLIAMFMLGACSTVGTSLKELVGGKDIYLDSEEFGFFSEDGSTLTLFIQEYEYDDDYNILGEKEDVIWFELELKSRASEFFTYYGVNEYGEEYSVEISSVDEVGGLINGMRDFTWVPSSSNKNFDDVLEYNEMTDNLTGEFHWYGKYCTFSLSNRGRSIKLGKITYKISDFMSDDCMYNPVDLYYWGTGWGFLLHVNVKDITDDFKGGQFHHEGMLGHTSFVWKERKES